LPNIDDIFEDENNDKDEEVGRVKEIINEKE